MEGDTSLPERTLPEEMSAPERTLPGTAAGSSPAVVAERLSLNPKDAFHLDTKDALSVGGQPMPGPEDPSLVTGNCFFKLQINDPETQGQPLQGHLRLST